jgi:hypothetical protein
MIETKGANAPLLDGAAVYLSPLGRCCRLCPTDALRPQSTWATLLYDRRDGSRPASMLADGFMLSRANWHLLRRIA